MRNLPYRKILFLGFAIGLLITSFQNCGEQTQLSSEDESSMGANSKVLAINPASKVVPVNTSFTFTAKGGKAPYTFSIASGAGIASIDANSGLFLAVAVSNSIVVRVTDALGDTSNAVVTSSTQLGASVSPSSTISVGGSAVITASGGSGSYNFRMQAGSLGSLNSNVYLAPTVAGIYYVEISDALTPTLTATIPIVVVELCISPDGTNGEARTAMCPTGQTGSIAYVCTAPNWVETSNTCATPTTCTSPTGAAGSTRAASCPAGQTGTISYTCTAGAWVQTASTCSAQAASCGSYANGSTWGWNVTSKSCIGFNTGGSCTLCTIKETGKQCVNGVVISTTRNKSASGSKCN